MTYTEKTFKKYEILKQFDLTRAQGKDLEDKSFIIKVATYKYKYDLNFFTKENLLSYKSLWLQNAKKRTSIIRKQTMQKLWSNEDYRKAQSKAIKEGQNKIDSKQRMSNAQIKRYASQESHNKLKIAMNKPEIKQKISLSNKVTKAQKRLSGYYLTEAWLSISKRQKQLEFETKKKNKSFNTSSQAEYCKKLISNAGFKISIDNCEVEYPFNENLHCDLYLNELDLWIEFHYSHYHGPKCCHEPFDKNNKKHKEALEKLKNKFINMPKNSKGTNQYGIMIYTWTDLDVRKRQCAIDNKLNWIAFYNIEDFEKWYNINMVQ